MVPYYRWKHIVTTNVIQEKYWSKECPCHYYIIYKTDNWLPIVDISSENRIAIFVSNNILYPSAIIHDETQISYNWRETDAVHIYKIAPIRISRFISIAVCQTDDQECMIYLTGVTFSIFLIVQWLRSHNKIILHRFIPFL